VTEVGVLVEQLPHGVGLALPAYATAFAAGADLLAAVPEDAPILIPPGGRALVPTGLKIALPEGYEAQIRPRSGLALRHGVTVLNAPGTIDADYRGEVGVVLHNAGASLFTINRGDRIAQLVVAPVVRVAWQAGDVLAETSGRGAGGFGSTGVSSGASAVADNGMMAAEQGSRER
jgi:dUTP pyrophosphatase